MRRSELPSSRAAPGANRQIARLYATRSSDETTTACVTLIRAVLTFPCARWIDATTEAPTPNISPTPVLMRNSGAVILTAASASLPTPRPTKMPSVMTNAAEKTIPRTVGISSLRNNRGISMLPKSILSFMFSFFGSSKITLPARSATHIVKYDESPKIIACAVSRAASRPAGQHRSGTHGKAPRRKIRHGAERLRTDGVRPGPDRRRPASDGRSRPDRPGNSPSRNSAPRRTRKHREWPSAG